MFNKIIPFGAFGGIHTKPNLSNSSRTMTGPPLGYLPLNLTLGWFDIDHLQKF